MEATISGRQYKGGDHIRSRVPYKGGDHIREAIQGRRPYQIKGALYSATLGAEMEHVSSVAIESGEEKACAVGELLCCCSSWRISSEGCSCCSRIEPVGKALLEKSDQSVDLHRLKSGPLGDDQQLSAMISEGQVDILIFLWDAISVQPHDVDVKALLRIAVLYNVPTACNRATADFGISSTLLEKPYTPKDNKEHIQNYLERDLPV